MSNMMYIRRWPKIELAICDLEGAFGGLHIHLQSNTKASVFRKQYNVIYYFRKYPLMLITRQQVITKLVDNEMMRSAGLPNQGPVQYPHIVILDLQTQLITSSSTFSKN
jgi:hypothetical protein